MGSAASMEALPEILSMDQVKMLCGASFNEQEFKFIAQGSDSISRDDFLAALHNKTDVFLTHDWGKELGQDNHARVAEINRRLQARGLTTWFDSEQMEGNVKKQMALGIDNAQCIIAFITKRYIDKVGGFNAEDNCQLEFNYAARRKTASRMIPVVMEDRVRNTGTWDGEVGLVLGGRLYVDMCGDVYDDVYTEQCIDDLYHKIIKIIKNPIKGLNSGSTIVVNKTSADDMPTQVRPSPKKERKNVKPLKDLSVEEVSTLLESNKLSKFVAEMKDNDVDGPTLMETNNDEELKELGITLGVKARMFYKKLEGYKFYGVPFAELGIEDEKVDEVSVQREKSTAPVVQHGDGTFTIAGATGGFAARINGTFEIGDDMQNGLPVYEKVGDSDTIIDLVKGVSGWRWYVKQLSDKGPSSSKCYAYAQCVDEDMKLASQTDPSMWWVHVDGKFGVQSSMTVTPSSSLPPPANIQQLLNQARTTIKKAKEDEVAEEQRAPHPGAFTIAGTAGKNPTIINGTFEPTKESQNGFPVYRKKGKGDYWVEMVYKPTSGWRWYLKPTANKGPDSSICFGYFQCVEDDIKLPQDCASWHVNTDDGFKQQETCSVSLASSKPLPADVTSRYQAGLAIVRDRKAARVAEQTHGVLPGSFTLSGATGTREGRFNGSYEPSTESQNSFPVYKKKGDPDSWIELVHGASGWRWYLKPTANKGPDSSICFACYYQCDETDVKLPSEVTDGWFVHGTSGFTKQSTTMKLDSTASLPAHLQTLVSDGKAMMKKKYEDKIGEQTRGAAPCSFRLEGATGKSANSINNTFEPTIESQNGFPRYKKKGADDLFVEVVYKSTTGWRWYLKPKANLGPTSSICFAYCNCNEDDMKLPGDMPQWFCSTADGFVMQNTVKVSRVGVGDSADVEERLGEGRALVLKMKSERLAELSRGAVHGSFQIDGATGKSANQTNGVYEPTQEVQNGMPVYKKKGTGDMWIELVHGASGWRWYLKPTANKGADSSICFTYFTMSGKDVKLPLECTDSWTTNTADGFKSQSSIKLTAVGDAGQPAHVTKLLTAAAWKTLH